MTYTVITMRKKKHSCEWEPEVSVEYEGLSI